jgi:hypothetical protein
MFLPYRVAYLDMDSGDTFVGAVLSASNEPEDINLALAQDIEPSECDGDGLRALTWNILH